MIMTLMIKGNTEQYYAKIREASAQKLRQEPIIQKQNMNVNTF